MDALRGFALFGLLLVHCVERFELYWLDPQPDVWFEAVFAIFAGKSFAIFALLFGFSFTTIMENERARGGDFTWRFVWRLVLLLFIGTLHALIYRGDILQVLAVIGLLMVPTDRIRSDRILFLLAALCFLQLPLLARGWAAMEGAHWATQTPVFWNDSGLGQIADGTFTDLLWVNMGPGMISKWSFYIETGRAVEIAGLFLVGMVIQRRRLFVDAAHKRGVWAAFLLASAMLWMLVTLVDSRVLAPEAAPMAKESLAAFFAQLRTLGATFFQLSLFVLSWHLRFGKWLSVFAPVGKMTLTLYVLQSLTFAPVFYGFGLGLYDDLGNRGCIVLGISAFALQIGIAKWWFRYFSYGPLEWIWRAATRGTLAIPFRRPRAAAS